jgi:hypothetical protein
MLILFAAILAVWGLINLVVPPSMMVNGSRWQYRDGDRLAPSSEYVSWYRISGVLLLLGAVAVVVIFFVGQAKNNTDTSLEEAWDFRVYGNEEPLPVTMFPEVVHVDDVDAELATMTGSQVSVGVWKSAIVGVDPIGNLGVDIEDGELLLAVSIHVCDLGPVLVHESDQTVTIAVTATSDLMLGDQVVDCANPSVGLQGSLEDMMIVRVPLDSPVGDRELVLPSRVGPNETAGAPAPVPVPAPLPAEEAPAQ